MVTNLGATGSGDINTIEYFTIASTGNATDFGDLTVVTKRNASASSNTRGLFAGGTRTGVDNDVIDYITIASTGNATDFGDLTQERNKITAVSSSIRAVIGSSNSFAVTDYVTIASTGNAIDWGDLGVNAQYRGSASNSHGGL